MIQKEQSIFESIIIPSRMLFIMWLVFFVQAQYDLDFGFLGIYPRSLKGLPGILTAPVIHRSLQHIVANTLPLLILGTLLFSTYPEKGRTAFFRGYLFTNILVWIFGREGYHIGASGLVYAIAFYLVTAGIFSKRFKSLLVAVAVVILYSGLFVSLFRELYGVSWEAHLMGAVAGSATAIDQFLLRKQRA